MNLIKIQDEVRSLDNKYKNLKLSEHITFRKYGFDIIVYGGVITLFTF